MKSGVTVQSTRSVWVLRYHAERGNEGTSEFL